MSKALYSRPIEATCQPLIGHWFGNAIMGGKFKRIASLYIRGGEKREKGYQNALSLSLKLLRPEHLSPPHLQSLIP